MQRLKNKAKRILGIMGGVAIAIILGVTILGLVPQPINQFIPSLIGGLFVNYVVKEKGWLYGIITGIFISILTLIPLILMELKVESPPCVKSPISLHIFGLILSGLLIIFYTTLGACIGQFLSNLKKQNGF